MQTDDLKLAFQVTIHCIVGCGLGDTAGLAIGTALGWATMHTMILAVFLGFIGGYGLTIFPLLKRGFDLKAATKITVSGETASIVVMETAQNLTTIVIPGLLSASIFSLFFWSGLLVSALAGFLAAYPVNYFMIIRGMKKGHLHH